MDWLAQGLGGALVAAVLLDIYFTVLHMRTGKGLIGVPVSKGVWRLFRRAALALPAGRDRLLAYAGPTILVAIVAVWLGLLVCGFALITWPALGTAIRASQGPTPTDFATALYYSGYGLTTLGTGDIIPTTAPYRLLLVLEAGVGFATFTTTLTYILSIYSALIRRNTFALSVQHRTGGTGDAAELLARLGAGGQFGGTSQQLAGLGENLLNLLESHHSYPILRYFRFREPHYALPRIALVAMDLATLIRSALDERAYAGLVRSAALAEVWGGGCQLLAELGDPPAARGQRDDGDAGTPDDDPRWRERYRQAVTRLADEGIATVADPEAGARRYVALRRQWEPPVRRLADHMACDWREVDAAAGGGRRAAGRWPMGD